MATPTHAERLANAKLAIDNALNTPKIKEALADYGYNDKKLQEGLALYEAATQSFQTQQIEYGEQFDATQALQDLRETAYKSYIRLVKIARIAFENQSGIAAQLAINGPRKKDLIGWMEQADLFYKNALSQPKVLKALEAYGITAEKIEVAQAEMVAVSQARAEQVKGRGEAQNATKVKEIAMNALDEWMSSFIKIARIALEDSPQLLEVLGLVVPS